MTSNALLHAATSPDNAHRRSERRPTAAVEASQASSGLGGNTLAHIVEENCPDMLVAAGVVIEHLDAQAGTWQFSADQGQNWRAIRTDLINRAGNLGLALDRDARLRVLPFGGHRVTGVRVAFHTVQRSHGQGNGSYRAYAPDERDGGSRTVTLVLSLSSINGAPPAVHVPRPRNKRAMVQRAAASVGASLSGAMAMA
ncbi:hypothetical protein CLU85_1972 [Acidovorax sp. 69]|uniref:hypothetical protein n=1 Tax=Acidovorax sp. 69 TaxID=2035202 RepID=UPI000C247137|nr:hypothetical protein [Acidovorax sp. 69]PJI97198.1 hypothetical protein CLU85_1972 [Acidovorax sp. 69]